MVSFSRRTLLHGVSMPIKKIFKSKLVSKTAKLNLHWTIIRPVITNASEMWILKEYMKQKLLVTERKILRKIFGPTKDRDGM
jgi:hypothetical protein